MPIVFNPVFLYSLRVKMEVYGEQEVRNKLMKLEGIVEVLVTDYDLGHIGK